MQSFMLGLKGIQCQQLLSKFAAFEQLARGNDFALVLLQRDRGLDALAGLADGAGDSQAATAPQMFAIDGGELISVREQLLVLPMQQQGFESLWVHRRQRPLKSAFRRHIVMPGGDLNHSWPRAAREPVAMEWGLELQSLRMT